MTRVSEVLARVRQCFDEDSVCYGVVGGNGLLSYYKIEGSVFQLAVMDLETILYILCEIPLIVPERKRLEVADAINRANVPFPLGRFEMEPTKGSLHYTMALPLVDVVLTAGQVRFMTRTTIFRAVQFHRAFCRLIYADDLSPAEVIAEVEMTGRSSS